ncbi:hypothetical protein [Levilactobacillus huananensis]|uniref:hypothetical protein n=1 Tax=Levilactobacillus huananensis TaxID=2486019 RepID=UPI000F7A9842|nr:hypothetical protein [Levilactobacillus huananensis]
MSDDFEFYNSDDFKKFQEHLKQNQPFYDSRKLALGQIKSMNKLTAQQMKMAKQNFNFLDEFKRKNPSIFSKNTNAYSQLAKDSPWIKEIIKDKGSLIQSSSFNVATKQNMLLATSYNQVKNLIGSSSELLTSRQRANFQRLLSQQPFKDFYTQSSHPTREQTYNGNNHSDALNDSKSASENTTSNPGDNGQKENIVREQPSNGLEDDIAEAKYHAENFSDDELTSDDMSSLDITFFWIYIKSLFDFIVQVKGYYEAIQFLVGLFNWISKLLS